LQDLILHRLVLSAGWGLAIESALTVFTNHRWFDGAVCVLRN
jgi:hypothetical protein